MSRIGIHAERSDPATHTKVRSCDARGMQISARIRTGEGGHEVTVATEGSSKSIAIAPKPTGGSSINGGEMLAAALATCFCNDLYREAATRGIALHSVDVSVDAEFGGRGDPARKIRYRVAVSSDVSDEVIRALIAETDRVAEVHNTLRCGIAVELE